MLYQINNVTVSLGGKEVLSHINFEIHGNEKIAVTGRNGAGKTTLLRFIAGELEADRDDKRTGAAIETARRLTVGMLGQDRSTDCDEAEGTVNAGRNTSEHERWEYERLMTGFGFGKEDFDRDITSFSGGEQTKLKLVRLLLDKPDILLLDEPTNHLDMKTLEWLEEYLRDYRNAVVFVSHDRFFTDRVADVVYEVENGALTRYPGNYTQYRLNRQKRLEKERREWERSTAELERLEALVERFKNKPRKAAFARSKRTIISRMGELKKPRENDVHIFTGEIVPEEPGAKWVLEAEHLKCGYTEPVIELSVKLRRGQKVAVIGDNGSGKSTFLKTVSGKLKSLDGKCTLGNRVTIGYFDQFSAELEYEGTVFEYFSARFPNMEPGDVRKILANYLFRGVQQQTAVNALSGGEKARLVIAAILTARPNFLVLDEPTNHMDIDAKETVESALQTYRGTILLVSHDRYLISRLAETFYIFDGGKALYYPFDYGHYLERTQQHRKLNGLVTSEEEALIAGLKAVPRRERHELGFASLEEAHGDWKLRIARETLETAQNRLETAQNEEIYAEAQKTLLEAEKAWYEVWSEYLETEPGEETEAAEETEVTEGTEGTEKTE